MKTCRISGCCEPAVEGYMPLRCAKHKADRQRKQKLSERANYISSARGHQKCPDCGTPFDQVPLNSQCDGHLRWNTYQNEAIARRIREAREHLRADADRALSLLEALRDYHGIDLLSGR